MDEMLKNKKMEIENFAGKQQKEVNKDLQGLLIEGKMCVRYGQKEGNRYSDQVQSEISEIVDKMIKQVKLKPENWKDVWNFVFENAKPEKKFEFLKAGLKGLSEEDKTKLDKQILKDGNFLDSLEFCKTFDWANVPAHQSKVMDGTNSVSLVTKFYTSVPSASYLKTQSAILRLKRKAEKEFNNGQEESKSKIKEASHAIDQIYSTMEKNYIRRSIAEKELPKPKMY